MDFSDEKNEYSRKQLTLKILRLSAVVIKNIALFILFYICLKKSKFPDTTLCKQIELLSVIFTYFLIFSIVTNTIRIFIELKIRRKNKFIICFQIFKSICYWTLIILIYFYYDSEIDCSYLGKMLYYFLLVKFIIIVCVILYLVFRFFYFLIYVCHDEASNAECSSNALLASSQFG